jgi:Prokaryotic E2 family E
MPLLFDEDYVKLKERGLSYEESEQQRFFIFTQYPLPGALYTVAACDVLVVIPANYNQAGNDMFWTFPRLYRTDGKQIPNVNDPGGGDPRSWKEREFCRWSRHWVPPNPGVWRPGKDDIISIYRRIDWALRNPDAQ